jgi:hypothetical protein
LHTITIDEWTARITLTSLEINTGEIGKLAMAATLARRMEKEFTFSYVSTTLSKVAGAQHNFFIHSITKPSSCVGGLAYIMSDSLNSDSL